jgi:transcriptional regulator with XRE-family HTH domain
VSVAREQPAKQLLREQGYSVTGVARRLRLSRDHLGRVLNGDVRPSHEVRVELCQLLDRPVTQLFTCDALSDLYRTGPGRPAVPTTR